MPTRKTLIKAEAGVRLERIEQLSAQGRVQQAHYRLRTLRPLPVRMLTDERAALDAFDLEVITSLADPIASKAAERLR